MNNGSPTGNPDMSEMLNRILSDPQAMNSVMQLAGNLMSNTGGEESVGSVGSAPRPPAESDGSAKASENGEGSASSLLNGLGLGGMKLPKLLSYDTNRVKLLEALKPYLGDSRRDKISYLLNIMQILRLLEGGMG